MGTLQKGEATDICSNSRERKRVIKAAANCTLWSELPAVLLELILKRVGVKDYFMFGCVCKSWRSVAVALKQDQFMASQAPLVVLMSIYARKYCYLYNIFDKTLCRIALPHLSGNECVGFTCGYLVLRPSNWARKRPYIWLVNPFTRHELEFPSPPDQSYSNVILASLAKSDSDFVVLAFSRRLPFQLQFCRSGDVNWTVLESYSNPSGILDVVVFKGKIYVLSCDHSNHSEIWTLNFSSPSVTSLRVESERSFSGTLCCWNLHLFASNEELYVVDFRPAKGVTKFYELNFERKEWENVNLKDEVLFMGGMKCCGLSLLPPSWQHFDKQLNRVFYLGKGYDSDGDGRTVQYVAGGSSKFVPATPEDWKPDTLLSSPLWYFPHLYSNVDSVY